MSEFVIKYARLNDWEFEKVVEVLTNKEYKPYFPSGTTVLQQVKNWFPYDDEPINLFIHPSLKEFGYCSDLDYHSDNEVIIVDNSESLELVLDAYNSGYFNGLTNKELSDKYGDVLSDLEGVSQSYHHGHDWNDIYNNVPFSKKIDISELTLDELEDLKENVESMIDEKKKPTKVLKLVMVDVREDISRTKPDLDFVIALHDEEYNIIYFRENDMGRNSYLRTSVNYLRSKYIMPDLLHDTEEYVGFSSDLDDIIILGEVAEWEKYD